MQLLIEPTEEFVHIAAAGPIRARVWRAIAPDGSVLHALIAAIAAAADEPANVKMARSLVACASPLAGPAPAAPETVEGPQAPAITLFPHDHPACADAERAIDVLQPSLERLAMRIGIKAVLDALATLYLHWIVRHYGAGWALWHLDRMREAVSGIAAGVADPRLGAAPQGSA